MKIRYFAYLREVTGRSEETWPEPAARLGELLPRLCARYGPAFRRWVLDDKGALSQMGIVLVNGHDARDMQGLETELCSEDVIAIFPPVAGGACDEVEAQ